MIFEICVDSVEGALAAQEAGAQRVELCDDLVEGGTTPSLGMVEVVRRQVSIGVHVIIRPRGGDFVYSDLEFEVMRRDILAAKQAGANGVVIGLLKPDGSVDSERTRVLLDLARPMTVTFHRAFDMTRDPAEALETLCAIGVDRVLTSGQKPTALEGIDCIARMVSLAQGRMIILAGGGVNADNVAEIAARSGVQEVHLAARRWIESPMVFRNVNCNMGKAYQPEEYWRKETGADLVRKVIQAAA